MKNVIIGTAEGLRSVFNANGISHYAKRDRELFRSCTAWALEDVSFVEKEESWRKFVDWSKSLLNVAVSEIREPAAVVCRLPDVVGTSAVPTFSKELFIYKENYRWKVLFVGQVVELPVYFDKYPRISPPESVRFSKPTFRLIITSPPQVTDLIGILRATNVCCGWPGVRPDSSPDGLFNHNNPHRTQLGFFCTRPFIGKGQILYANGTYRAHACSFASRGGAHSRCLGCESLKDLAYKAMDRLKEESRKEEPSEVKGGKILYYSRPELTNELRFSRKEVKRLSKNWKRAVRV
jgi:hypothetical protein